ncbi:MAG: hypothetical protein EOO04_25705 [Chitinophagaceae bacterium]|nr:MAG: hypothetical protein EOO04_25705 [Chitinophagaceae bacterium]
MAKKAKPAPAETAAEQPYYLQRAHIKDFRSIRDAAVEFKPGLNIIIGANGSGKTNFLQSIKNSIDFYGRGTASAGSSFNISSSSVQSDIFIEYKGRVSDKPFIIHHDLKRAEQKISSALGNQDKREGPVARTIEEQTSKLPSDLFLWAAGASMVASLALKVSGHKHTALFVGQWAAPFLLLGIYNKIVKVAGHDEES